MSKADLEERQAFAAAEREKLLQQAANLPEHAYDWDVLGSEMLSELQRLSKKNTGLAQELREERNPPRCRRR